MRRFGLAGFVLTCVLALPSVVFAQAGIAGNVKDSSGAVLPGVTVEASSPALIEKTRSVVTDGSGNYKIENLRPGTYSVTFTLPGFNTVKRDGIELTGSFVATINADLKVGAIEETITVTGETPIVDIQSTARQQVLNKDVIEAIPTGRSYNALGVLLPGVNSNAQDVGGQNGGGMATLTAHGSAGGDQRVLQNGLNVMTLQTGGGNIGGMIPNQSGAQEVAVDTDAASAERQTGGVAINYIQRDGGNTFKSYSFFTYANEHMAGDNLTSRVQSGPFGAPGVANAPGLSSVNQVKDNWEVNPSFGGPIMKDKLWYYWSLRYQRAQNYAAGMFQNANALNPDAFTYVPTGTKALSRDGWWDDSQLRLTWQANAKNKFAGTWDQQAYCQCPDNISATTAPEAARDRRFPTQQLIHGEWFSPITSRLLVEFVGLHRTERWGNMDLRPQDQSPEWPSFGGSFDRYFPASAYPTYQSLVGILEQAPVNGQQANLAYRAYSGLTATGFTPLNNNWVPSYHYRGSVSYVTGTHAVKVGFQEAVGYIYNTNYMQQPMAFRANSAKAPLNPDGTIVAPIFNQVTYFALPTTSQNNQDHDLGLYAQDKWTFKRMTLNYGLRFDYFKSEFPDQTLAPAAQLVAVSMANGGSGNTARATVQNCATTTALGLIDPATGKGSLCGGPNVDWKDITPRFGLAYDLRGDGKTAIKVSANKYVTGNTANGVGANDNPVTRLVNSASRTWTDANHDSVPQCDPLNPAANGECLAYTGAATGFGNLVPSTVSDSALKNGWNKRGYNWEFSAGVQQQVLPRVSVEASYFRRIFGNFTVTENLAYDGRNGCGTAADHSGCFNEFSVIAPVDPRLGDRSGATITGFFDPTNAAAKFANLNSVVLVKDLPGNPNQIQHWNGVDVNVNARLQNGVLLQGGLSTGRNSTNNCAVTAVVPEALGSVGLQDCAVTEPFETQAKLIAVYTVPKVGVQVAGTFQSIPGTFLQDVLALGGATAPVAAFSNLQAVANRGTLNAAGGQKNVNLLNPGSTLLAERLNQLDVRFAKILRYGRTRTNISLDIFNALNNDTILTYSTSNDSLWRPQSILQARFVKVSAQFDF